MLLFLSILANMNNEPIIHFAPLQGYTDNAYRETHFKEIGNVDFYYSPYLSVENDGTIKSVSKFLPNKDFFHSQLLIPQILPCNLSELKQLATCVSVHGFTTVNINLGCPYPMVTRKGKGAALIKNPEYVNQFLEYFETETKLKVSLKIRSGLEEQSEIFRFLGAIDKNRVDSIIIHPRTAKQLYKGLADVSTYVKCVELFPSVRLIYNGDIQGFSNFIKLTEILPAQQEWMIGRGLLKNLFLPWQLKNNTGELPQNHSILLHSFCDRLYIAIKESSNDEAHALNRIRIQLIGLFENNLEMKKVVKKLKKLKTLTEVRQIIDSLI